MTDEHIHPPRVRMAPSPTGPFHWGTARTAVFNWLFARKLGGSFVVRIEDTDKERSEKRFENGIFEGLRWLGLDWDEGPVMPHSLKDASIGDYGPYRQSERVSIHRKYLEQLLQEEKAYYCYCTKEELEAEREGMLASGIPPRYSGHCRELQKPPAGKTPQVIRLKTPEVSVEFKDIIRGSITFDAKLFGDFVIAKNLDIPLFHLAVVVDDALMKISHVIRGEDHIANTPKQILIGKALGLPQPEYAHLPLVLGQNREKLSKRHLSSSLIEYRDKGYLHESLINFISFLGWHPKENEEILSPKEIIDRFELKKVQKGGAIFDEEKLLWLNAQHIRKMPVSELKDRVTEFMAAKNIPPITPVLLEKLVALEQPRMKTLADFLESTDFFFSLVDYSPTLLIPKNQTQEETLSVLRSILELFEQGEEQFNRTPFLLSLEALIAERGRGGVLWPLRVALTGKAASPDPIDIMEILSPDEVVRRLQIAINKLNELA